MKHLGKAGKRWENMVDIDGFLSLNMLMFGDVHHGKVYETVHWCLTQTTMI